MIFKSISDFESRILPKLNKSVINSEKKIYERFDEHFKMFYGEYNPVEYIRLNQLPKTLIRDGVKYVGNGYEAEIHFDASKLNYPNPAVGKSGVLHSVDLNNEQIFELNIHGSHGGWTNGVSIWDGTMESFNGDLKNVLVEELKKQGIPII